MVLSYNYDKYMQINAKISEKDRLQKRDNEWAFCDNQGCCQWKRLQLSLLLTIINLHFSAHDSDKLTENRQDM